ncbi:nuclear transport factor 2 family protein [Roseovarius pelagicus]|uniref:Nuclear transport factor 2 family protein n=1 Tax=Roseovarius pelagicus TaxID=2980108 RepID=A0ABY6D5L9_9RHOB|nr:nuclear transport factor 2 family protein [Roseovarius pelagicus]UXX81442.1 nuclear transport factor 2 family protein [Roseovarius pelagicus]
MTETLTETPTTVTHELLDAIGDAFNSNDINAVMPYFAQDAVFDHGAGPDAHGIRFEGYAALEKVFGTLFESVENVHWKTLDARIAGNKAYCEYLRTARLKDGTVQEYQSVDIFTFEDGLIVYKDTYSKNRSS